MQRPGRPARVGGGRHLDDPAALAGGLDDRRVAAGEGQGDPGRRVFRHDQLVVTGRLDVGQAGGHRRVFPVEDLHDRVPELQRIDLERVNPGAGLPHGGADLGRKKSLAPGEQQAVIVLRDDLIATEDDQAPALLQEGFQGGGLGRGEPGDVAQRDHVERRQVPARELGLGDDLGPDRRGGRHVVAGRPGVGRRADRGLQKGRLRLEGLDPRVAIHQEGPNRLANRHRQGTAIVDREQVLVGLNLDHVISGLGEAVVEGDNLLAFRAEFDGLFLDDPAVDDEPRGDRTRVPGPNRRTRALTVTGLDGVTIGGLS